MASLREVRSEARWSVRHRSSPHLGLGPKRVDQVPGERLSVATCIGPAWTLGVAQRRALGVRQGGRLGIGALRRMVHTLRRLLRVALNQHRARLPSRTAGCVRHEARGVAPLPLRSHYLHAALLNRRVRQNECLAFHLIVTLRLSSMAL